ncbi:MAG TPA: peptide-modifying radical SAM enzyme CbpB [Spirochaetia bacterium]|nr:peptide-modifying radical SAM enzyme CbpB [Spirochaetia bacterium]
MKNKQVLKYHINAGNGPFFQFLDISHDYYVAAINPDTAFWSLIKKEEIAATLHDRHFVNSFRKSEKKFLTEMNTLRFGLLPAAAYINPTDRCNSNCPYCYLSEESRMNGELLSYENLTIILQKLMIYFSNTVKNARKPDIIFHGAEPLLNADTLFRVITEFKKHFNFGIQTNAILLDSDKIAFIKKNELGIGISLDGTQADINDITRKKWDNTGYFNNSINALEKLRNYNRLNVMCTINSANVRNLPDMVEFLHDYNVSSCMLNMIRRTMEKAESVLPDEDIASSFFIKALDKSHELFRKSGRKIIISNFANIILSIVAPTARNLMCDISPCGGGRCFFAISASGDIYPCSEFLSIKDFNAGNIFTRNIENVLTSPPFLAMLDRTCEKIDDCKNCSIKHYCGAPCPAEAFSRKLNILNKGTFCNFYIEQAKYAFRLIADQKADDFLPDGWDSSITASYQYEKK